MTDGKRLPYYLRIYFISFDCTFSSWSLIIIQIIFMCTVDYLKGISNKVHTERQKFIMLGNLSK